MTGERWMLQTVVIFTANARRTRFPARRRDPAAALPPPESGCRRVMSHDPAAAANTFSVFDTPTYLRKRKRKLKKKQ